MKSKDRKVIVYIAMSLDGYIAKPNDDLSFLDAMAVAGEDYGYQAFVETIDTVLIGRKTFDWVVKQIGEPSHKDKTTYVITRTPKPSFDNVHFYTENLADLVQELKSKSGKNIFCDGGAELVNALLMENLIDELIVSVIPVVLGAGTKLFHDNVPERQLKLMHAKPFKSGLVQVHYQLISKT